MVLKVPEGDKTINEIVSEYEIIPKKLINQKHHFLENMSLTFDKSSVVKEYKDEIENLNKTKLMQIFEQFLESKGKLKF